MEQRWEGEQGRKRGDTPVFALRKQISIFAIESIDTDRGLIEIGFDKHVYAIFVLYRSDICTPFVSARRKRYTDIPLKIPSN